MNICGPLCGVNQDRWWRCLALVLVAVLGVVAMAASTSVHIDTMASCDAAGHVQTILAVRDGWRWDPQVLSGFAWSSVYAPAATAVVAWVSRWYPATDVGCAQALLLVMAWAWVMTVALVGVLVDQMRRWPVAGVAGLSRGQAWCVGIWCGTVSSCIGSDLWMGYGAHAVLLGLYGQVLAMPVGLAAVAVVLGGGPSWVERMRLDQRWWWSAMGAGLAGCMHPVVWRSVVVVVGLLVLVSLIRSVWRCGVHRQHLWTVVRLGLWGLVTLVLALPALASTAAGMTVPLESAVTTDPITMWLRSWSFDDGLILVISGAAGILVMVGSVVTICRYRGRALPVGIAVGVVTIAGFLPLADQVAGPDWYRAVAIGMWVVVGVGCAGVVGWLRSWWRWPRVGVVVGGLLFLAIPVVVVAQVGAPWAGATVDAVVHAASTDLVGPTWSAHVRPVGVTVDPRDAAVVDRMLRTSSRVVVDMADSGSRRWHGQMLLRRCGVAYADGIQFRVGDGYATYGHGLADALRSTGVCTLMEPLTMVEPSRSALVLGRVYRTGWLVDNVTFGMVREPDGVVAHPLSVVPGFRAQARLLEVDADLVVPMDMAMPVGVGVVVSDGHEQWTSMAATARRSVGPDRVVGWRRGDPLWCEVSVGDGSAEAQLTALLGIAAVPDVPGASVSLGDRGQIRVAGMRSGVWYRLPYAWHSGMVVDGGSVIMDQWGMACVQALTDDDLAGRSMVRESHYRSSDKGLDKQVVVRHDPWNNRVVAWCWRLAIIGWAMALTAIVSVGIYRIYRQNPTCTPSCT